ncbi:MAG: hypothetical protein LBD07_06905 [Spirochaetaceae bacterium]|nr:hypothetical protein [Spirochaetaceae bacterium]
MNSILFLQELQQRADSTTPSAPQTGAGSFRGYGWFGEGRPPVRMKGGAPFNGERRSRLTGFIVQD